MPPANTGGFNSGPTGDPRSLLAREPEPPALVLNELDCYHFRVLDPRVFATLSATRDAATIGHRSHI
jgi:hypothetical protein